MKEIARFYEVSEAQIATGYLRAQGFEAQLADQGMLGVEPHLRIALGGYRLMVPDKEAYTARLALEEVRGTPEERHHLSHHACAVCGSDKLRRIRSPLVALFSFIITWGGIFPFTDATKNLRCTVCGHKQRAESEEEPA